MEPSVAASCPMDRGVRDAAWWPGDDRPQEPVCQSLLENNASFITEKRIAGVFYAFRCSCKNHSCEAEQSKHAVEQLKNTPLRAARPAGERQHVGTDCTQQQKGEQDMSIPQLAMGVREAARAIGVSRATLYRLAAEGRIAIRRLAGRSVVLTRDLEALADHLPAAPIRPRSEKPA